MTEILEIRSIGEMSPVFDLENYDLPENAVSFANNYVLRNNRYISINGEQLQATIAQFNPGYISLIYTQTGYFYLVAGRSAVKVYDGTTWTDISNVIAYGYGTDAELAWSGCLLGQIPVISNPSGFPEYWSPANVATKMQDLKFDAATTWRSRNFKCNVIRSHNNFLFALGLNEAGVLFPNAYRWSHPADVGGLPFSWDPTDISTIASREQVGEESIVDGLSLRDNFIIYTNRGIYALAYIGGDFVFERRPVSSTHYLLATNCVVEVLGSHYFLSNGDIFIYDGNNIYSILQKKFRVFLKNVMSGSNFNNCFAQVNPNAKEIWFFIVRTGSIYPNMAVIINYEDNNNVSIRDISGNKTHATFGPLNQASDTWTTATNPWTFYNNQWNLAANSPFNFVIMAVDALTSTSIYNQEGQSVTTNYSTIITREGLKLGQEEMLSTIVRVVPRINSSSTVLIEVGSQDSAEHGVRWKPGVVFDPNTDRKVDIRTTGKYHAWRISSIGDNYFELNGLDILYEYVGKRVGGFVPVVTR